MRHLFNGDAAADAANRGYVNGEIIVWRESLTHGPVRAAGREEWISQRAEFIERAFRPEDDRVAVTLRLQEEQLRQNASDSLAIWTERDLSCQLTFAYVCGILRQEEMRPYRLSLVSTNDGATALSSLHADQFRALWEKRRPLDEREVAAVAELWDAYSSDDPSRIAPLLASLAVPHLKESLAAHLRRFPSVADGLGSVERLILTSAAGAPTSFREILDRLRNELAILGFGDAQLLYELRRLATGKRRMIELRADDGTFSAGNLAKLVVVATSDGEAVLEGRHDAVELEGADYWLGGVHFLPGARQYWRWDEELQRIVRR